MKTEEHAYNDKESNLNEESDSLNNEINSNALLLIDDGDYLSNEEWQFAGDSKDKSQDDVKKEEHEELTVAETYTVGDPRTVMIHIEYASLTCRAVVTSNSYHNYLSGLKL